MMNFRWAAMPSWRALGGLLTIALLAPVGAHAKDLLNDDGSLPPAHAVIFKVATDPALYGPLIKAENDALSAEEKAQLRKMVKSFKEPVERGQVLTEKTSATGYTYSTSADECAGCHMLEFLQWDQGRDGDMSPTDVWTGGQMTGAMHRLAFLDDTFYHHFSEYGERDSCLRCHMPTTIYSADRSRGVYAPNSRFTQAANYLEGVTCVSCHLDQEGNIRGEHAYGPGEADHEVIADDDVLGSGYKACQSCHGDPFWGALSNTVKEWEDQAKDTGLNCVDCHMSTSDFEEESHAFPGAHSNTWLKMGINVELPETLSKSETFTATACNVFAGHNLPTGDQFRAYTVRVKVTKSSGQERFDHTISISPRFNAIVIQERVDYDRADPIPFGECRELPYASLEKGTYTVDYELGFWLLKPTYLEVIIPSLGSAQSDGEVFKVLETRSYTLNVVD